MDTDFIKHLEDFGTGIRFPNPNPNPIETTGLYEFIEEPPKPVQSMEEYVIRLRLAVQYTCFPQDKKKSREEAVKDMKALMYARLNSELSRLRRMISYGEAAEATKKINEILDMTGG